MVCSISNKFHQLYNDYVVPGTKKVDRCLHKYLGDYRVPTVALACLGVFLWGSYRRFEAEKVDLLENFAMTDGQRDCALLHRLAVIFPEGLNIADLSYTNKLSHQALSVLNNGTWTPTQLFEKATNCEPNNSKYLFDYCQTLGDKKQNCLDKVIALDSEYGDAWHALTAYARSNETITIQNQNYTSRELSEKVLGYEKNDKLSQFCLKNVLYNLIFSLNFNDTIPLDKLMTSLNDTDLKRLYSRIDYNIKDLMALWYQRTTLHQLGDGSIERFVMNFPLGELDRHDQSMIWYILGFKLLLESPEKTLSIGGKFYGWQDCISRSLELVPAHTASIQNTLGGMKDFFNNEVHGKTHQDLDAFLKKLSNPSLM